VFLAHSGTAWTSHNCNSNGLQRITFVVQSYATVQRRLHEWTTLPNQIECLADFAKAAFARDELPLCAIGPVMTKEAKRRRFNVKLRGLVLLLSIVVLSGCATLRHKVNDRFPPINENQQRQIAIDSTAKSLSSITAPTIAAEVNLSDAGRILLNDELSKLGVTKLSLVGAKQLLEISVEFHHQFVESDAGENATWRKVVATSKPDVSGSIVIFAGVKNPDINTINLADIPAMNLQLLPALSRIQVKELKVFGHYRARVLSDPIVGLLNIFRDNVSGILARSRFATISIPEVATKPINLDKSFVFDIAQQSVHTTISANPIQIPYELTGMAWRITDDRLSLVLQVLPKSAANVLANSVELKTFEDINNRFNEMFKSEFDLASPTGPEWVAVNKDLVATSLRSAVEQAAPCAGFSAPNISAPPAEKMISIPEDSANCRQDSTNCDIHCVRNSDNRSCDGNFFKKKACQIEKDAVNGRMAAEFGACLAGAAGKKAVCTAGQAAEQGSCEALKTAFNAAAAGEVGDVTAQVSGTAQAHVCLSHLNVSDDFANVQIDLTVSGTANANVSLGFSPRRIVGHALCYMPVTVKNDLNVSLSAPQWSISSPITIKQVGEASYLTYDIRGGDVSVSYSPSLPSFLLRDTPKIVLTCPIPGVIVAPTADISAFVAGIPNQFSLPIPTFAGSQVIPLPSLSIGNEKVNLKLQPLTSQSIVLAGSLDK
jgi:hypothetical protein